MKFKRFVLVSLSILAELIAQANVNMGFVYSPFLVKYNARNNAPTGLFEKTGIPDGHFFALNFYTALTRNSTLSFGLGFTQIRFQKETQGIFPESNAYGIAVIDQRNGYWTFPIAFYQSFSRRSNGYSGIRITYIPAVNGSSETNISTYAGAVQSNYAAGYQSNNQSFQHTLLLAISNQVLFSNKTVSMSCDPYIGFGSGYLKSDNMRICTFSLGIQLGFRFALPQISIERSGKSERDLKKKQELLKKQKEIEDQLKNQPKSK